MQVYAGGSTPTIGPFLGVSDPHLTRRVIGPLSVPVKLRVNPSNSWSRVHECDRRQTDRQTYHATGKMGSYRRKRLR